MFLSLIFLFFFLIGIALLISTAVAFMAIASSLIKITAFVAFVYLLYKFFND